MSKQKITVQTVIKADLDKVWRYWTQPDHIVNWAFATDEWEAPESENDLRIGGKFKTVMAAKDKSSSFDFAGEYTNVEEHGLIEYVMDDDRQVRIEFNQVPEGIKIVQTFDAESENSIEQQKQGWQAILENFKKYVEAN